MDEQETTREIALAAKLLIDHHMLDCGTFRENLRNDMKESRITIQSDFKEFRDEIKKLNWRVAMILGGIMLAAHGIDWFLGFHK